MTPMIAAERSRGTLVVCCASSVWDTGEVGAGIALMLRANNGS